MSEKTENNHSENKEIFTDSTTEIRTEKTNKSAIEPPETKHQFLSPTTPELENVEIVDTDLKIFEKTLKIFEKTLT